MKKPAITDLSVFGASGAVIGQILELFPYPIEIFDNAGGAVFANAAMVSNVGAQDQAGESLLGYNILMDPFANDDIGLRPAIERAFLGESVTASAILPRKAMAKLSLLAKGTRDILFMPVWGESDKPDYVCCAFVTESSHQWGYDVSRAKGFIDINWQLPFDAQKTSEIAGMRVKHLDAMFFRQYGQSMLDYYYTVKIGHIKDRLKDEVLTITEAFYVCGADIRSGYLEIFMQYAGESPKEYRQRIGLGEGAQALGPREGGSDAII